MSFRQHLARVSPLMAAAAGLMAWLVGHTAVLYADGLRYVAQAQALSEGAWDRGLVRSADHPAYASAVAAAHALIGGDSPADWQLAAQAASAAAAVLLVVPLYLLALELWGPTAAWIACLLTFLVPQTGHVFADALSESTFLLFWCWGAWSVARFLREGKAGWLVPSLGFAGLAYLARPEGLLLPASLVATLVLTAAVPSLRLGKGRWRLAMGLLVVGPLLAIGPYVALRGGIATKPAVARLLGTSGPSSAMAVERERPLDPGVSAGRMYLLGARAMVRSVAAAVTHPLLALAALGLVASWRGAGPGRLLLFQGVVVSAWCLALVRLHVTGGYCTPRHALLAALPLIAASARGLEIVAGRLARLGPRLAPAGGRWGALARRAALAALLIAGAAWWGPRTLAPINENFLGYRQAGDWIREHVPDGSRVLDLKGWALFYGQKPGYRFDDRDRAFLDAGLGWVVAHDAFLVGPWDYCQGIREKVGARRPVRTFPDPPRPGMAKVHVFDLSLRVAGGETAPPPL